ncbi:TetR/AcrR family transcriptional regulator [Rhodococcus sp. (in: high G+C Gram-positive bacteria)]|uniref:TetR/AcrR family transcriptional regulator n=1 Tax=Rhodococcus sp. TaxID=1831 RepID=UPI00257A1B08|nr:TetR/AcrR family transcriptional regulator [Rhodococcus sp. (in: high G+C Gram-positive bacteria)]MBQ9056462.1 TetR/AcrR family transcriptional regulator [Rhodococcus sp. (in: high G+C Gram-positive bacteria)]
MTEAPSVPDAKSNGIAERLIEAAIRLLAVQGPSALKARTVAAEAGMSTMVVYNYFGGVPELVAAVVDYGFNQIERTFARLPVTDDPVADLFTMALTTLDRARSNPHLYDAMFGLSTRSTYRPTSEKDVRRPGRSPAFRAAYAHIVDACARLGASGRVSINDPGAAAGALWSFVHGYISLDLAHHFAEFDDPVSDVLIPLGVTFCVGLGDDPDAALASHQRALSQSLHQ